MTARRSATDRPEYGWLRALKQQRERELMTRHGAHAIGIGRKRVGGADTDQLALLFYVERKDDPDTMNVDRIPATISFRPRAGDDPVELKTDVIEAPRARLDTDD